MADSFVPLTEAQYQSAQAAGFSPEQILQNEQIRKSQVTPPPSDTGGFANGLKRFIGSVESPFIGLAAAPVQALARLTGQPDPYAQGVPGVAGSTVPVSSLDLEKKLGDAAQVGSYLVPGEGALGALGMGVLQGAGSEMSQGAGAGDVALGGVLGGATSAVAGGATKLLGSGVSKVGDLISGEAFTKATQGIKDAYSSALNLNASERAFESKSGKDLAQVLFEHKAPIGRYDNGTLDASAAIDKLQAPLDALNAQAKEILSKPQGVVKDVSLSEAFEEVKNRIQKLSITQIEKNAAMQHAEKIFQAEVKQYGESVTPEVADQIKQGLWGSSFKGNLTSTDKLRGNVSYLAGNTLKKSIEDSVAGTDAGNVLPELNAKRGDLIDAIKRLSNLDGIRLLKGGRLGNMAGGVVGTIMGASQGGVLGGMAGDYFGTKAAEFLNNPATRVGLAGLKAKGASVVPKLLGKEAKPLGQAISSLGRGIRKSARPVGLISNVLTK